MDLFYSLVSDISVIPIEGESVLFKSENVSIKLHGKSVTLFLNEILPFLDGETTVQQICCKIPSLSFDDLNEHLNNLVNVGVLHCSSEPASGSEQKKFPTFFANFLNSLKIESSVAAQRLSCFKIGMVGLEAHGMQSLLALQQSGLSNFKIVDPFPCDESFLLTFPFLKNSASKMLRQDCIAEYLKFHHPAAEILCGPEVLSKENLEEFFKDRHLIIVCGGKGFNTLYHWINEISRQQFIPSLYGSVSGNRCTIGPFVIPAKTSCYTCYRMRQAESDDNFGEAMAYDEYLIKQESPSFFREKALPSTLNFVSCVISSEVIKYIFGIHPIALINGILEFDPVRLLSTIHPVLQLPNCPTYKKKTKEYISSSPNC